MSTHPNCHPPHHRQRRSLTIRWSSVRQGVRTIGEISSAVTTLWGFLAVVVTIGGGILLWVLQNRKKHREDEETDDVSDRAVNRLFERLTVLEAALLDEQSKHDVTNSKLTECLVQCARLKSELTAAREAVSRDAVTIKQLNNDVKQLRKKAGLGDA